MGELGEHAGVSASTQSATTSSDDEHMKPLDVRRMADVDVTKEVKPAMGD